MAGNVRELENVIHRALILAQSTGRDIIQEADLSLSNDNIAGSAQLDMLHKPLEEQILEMLRALKFEHAAISKTAKALGNRDRGTITEHFRGICFMEYVRSDFNRQKTVQNIAGTTDSQVIDRVDLKLSEYLDNLSDVIRNSEAPEAIRQPYKGLPKKYHAYLDRLVTYLRDTIHGK